MATLEHAGEWDEVLNDMDDNWLWEYELGYAIDNISYPYFIGERRKTVTSQYDHCYEDVVLN